MFHNRLPRRVEVDWARRREDRVPIVEPRTTFRMGELGYTEVDSRPIEGMIGWDPADGWVLNLPPDAAGPRGPG